MREAVLVYTERAFLVSLFSPPPKGGNGTKRGIFYFLTEL